jgi:hypothetical protein
MFIKFDNYPKSFYKMLSALFNDSALICGLTTILIRKTRTLAAFFVGDLVSIRWSEKGELLPGEPCPQKEKFFAIICDGLRFNFAILPFQIKAFSKVKADSWRPQAGGQAGVPGHGLVFTWLSEPHLPHNKVHKDLGSRVMASSSPGFQNLIFHTTRYIKIWGPGSWPRLHLALRTSSFTLQGT